MKGIRSNYEHTIFASYIGYITQAIVNNFVPLLFLTFQSTYGISLDKITLLVSLNFGVQLLVDFFAARFVDRIGYRPCVVAAHIFSAAGLAGLSFLPDAMADPYAGIVISIICYAIGGGLIEVLISPIVEACPTEHKDAVMSLLHSFYCWGHVFVVLASTLFFTFVGIDHWRTMALLWAVIPLFNCFYFLLVPIRVLVEDGKGMSVKELFQNRMFWLLFVLMLCAGASEQGMSQWASAFAEMGLGVSKTIGDLAGPCAFAVCMGASRVFYGKFGEHIRLERFMRLSCVLCIISYLMASFSPVPFLSLAGCALCGLSVGIMWPGCFSIGARSIRRGGTAMFAFFALAGDMGCAAGPGLVGMATDLAGGSLKQGILSAIIFPVILYIGMLVYKKWKGVWSS